MRTLLVTFGMCFVLGLYSCGTQVSVRSPKAKVIKVVPKHHYIVKVKGRSYYFFNGHYHKKTNKGYVVVKI